MTELTELKKILREHSYNKISGQMVDVQTANAMLTVRKALGKENQKKFDEMLKTPSGVQKLAHFSWRSVA